MAKKLRIIDDEVLERPFSGRMFIRILNYAKPYKGRLIGAIVLMIGFAVLSLVSPKVMSLIIGDLQKNDLSRFFWLIAIMVAVIGAGEIIQRYRLLLMEYLGVNVISDLRDDLFRHIQGLSLSFFDTRSAGKIMVRVINDVNSLLDLFTNGIVNVLVDCVTVVILLAAMLITDWRLTIIAMCMVPFLLLVLFKLKRIIRRRWQIVAVKRSTLNGYLHESLAGMRVTQAYTREGENSETFVDASQDNVDSWMKAIRPSSVFWPCLDIVSNIGTVLVYIVAVHLMQRPVNPLELSTLLLITWYMGRFWEPLNSLSNFYNAILSAMASIERIFEIMDTPQLIRDTGDEEDLPPIRGDVTFENVVFSYDKEKIILKDVSFSVKAGQTIALVGPTGSGKSTVVNLVSRFYDTTQGRVLIDGHDVKKVKLHSLRSQMSVMLQDSFIFSGTILDNIRYGKLDATEEEVIEAAKAVCAHEFISKMAKGYKTEVNERGSSLSVGQKQLISFARALLNDPKILILDEATSSIDTRTEKLIQQGLERLLHGRTSFVIAHRLSTIRKADCIMVVEDGKIVEHGTHEDLMCDDRGHYCQLVKAQYRFLEAQSPAV